MRVICVCEFVVYLWCVLVRGGGLGVFVRCVWVVCVVWCVRSVFFAVCVCLCLGCVCVGVCMCLVVLCVVCVGVCRGCV